MASEASQGTPPSSRAAPHPDNSFSSTHTQHVSTCRCLCLQNLHATLLSPPRSSDPSCPAQRLSGLRLCSTRPRGSQPPQRETRSPPGLRPCSALDSPLHRAGLSLLHAPCTSGLSAAAVQGHWPLGTPALCLLLRSSLLATSPGLTGPLRLHPQLYLGVQKPSGNACCMKQLINGNLVALSRIKRRLID